MKLDEVLKLRKGAKGIRGIPDGSGPEGKGPTGRRMGGCPKKEDFDNESDYLKAYKKWQTENKEEITIKKALEIRELRKAKYLKRTGSPGNYKYIYKEKKPVSSKEYMKEHATDIRGEADKLKRMGEEDFKRKKGEYDKKKLKEVLAERKKKVTEKKMEVQTLPQDINTLTIGNVTSLIKQSVKLPFKKLRDNQNIVEQQKIQVYRQQDAKAYRRFEVMENIYQAAVDIKKFKFTTASAWAKEIVGKIKQYKY